MQGSGVTDGIGFTLTNNIDCESGIIFDNDEDKTDSAALLPCIEQAREDIRILRQLQFLQQNR
ncbi:DUF957 domain-containing protein, partial [Escherichia coli]|uniref:DUF957 domain-containing protein n=1 Tax=Escherichia coli TaxID=562 RepID=UPI000D109997